MGGPNAITFGPATVVNSTKDQLLENSIQLLTFPNPFVQQSALQFHLPETSIVDLKVSNKAGREVAQLAAGSFNSGIHLFEWNAEDLPGGVYFVQLETENRLIVKRLVLTK